MRFSRALWVGILLILSYTIGLGQVAQRSPYKLQIDDVLRIQVYNQPQLTGDAPIGQDGAISAPFLGRVKAEGRTIDDMIVDLTKQYKDKFHLRDPIVSVTILAFRRMKVTIGGAVQRPSSVEIRAGDTVLSLFNQGGGASQDNADLRRSYLRRGGTREIIPIDIYAMTVYGDISQNYELHDGDELIVPDQRGNRINVLGMIQRPGPYPYREPMYLADAVALAGGEVRSRTRFSKTKIFRPKQGQPNEYLVLDVDFVKFMDKRDLTQNVLLFPGDTIYIPETNTPDFQQLGGLFNSAILINNLGSIFGLRLFGRN